MTTTKAKPKTANPSRVEVDDLLLGIERFLLIVSTNCAHHLSASRSLQREARLAFNAIPTIPAKSAVRGWPDDACEAFDRLRELLPELSARLATWSFNRAERAGDYDDISYLGTIVRVLERATIDDPGDWLTVPEVVELTGVEEHDVHRARKSGKLVQRRKSGWRRYHRADVIEWVNAGAEH